MLTLNIIPSSLKREIKNYQIQKLIKSLMNVLLVFSILIMSNMVVSNIYLNNYIKKEINPLMNEESSKKNIHAEAKLSEISKKINRLNEMQEDFIPWSNLLLFVAKNSPTNIKYNQITIDKETASLTLKGFASAREDLIKLRDILEKSDIITELDFPVSNILKMKLNRCLKH